MCSVLVAIATCFPNPLRFFLLLPLITHPCFCACVCMCVCARVLVGPQCFTGSSSSILQHAERCLPAGERGVIQHPFFSVAQRHDCFVRFIFVLLSRFSHQQPFTRHSKQGHRRGKREYNDVSSRNFLSRTGPGLFPDSDRTVISWHGMVGLGWGTAAPAPRTGWTRCGEAAADDGSRRVG